MVNSVVSSLGDSYAVKFCACGFMESFGGGSSGVTVESWSNAKNSLRFKATGLTEKCGPFDARSTDKRGSPSDEISNSLEPGDG